MTDHHYSNSHNSIISFAYSWFLAKNLSNFISHPWKLHHRYCPNAYTHVCKFTQCQRPPAFATPLGPNLCAYSTCFALRRWVLTTFASCWFAAMSNVNSYGSQGENIKIFPRHLLKKCKKKGENTETWPVKFNLLDFLCSLEKTRRLKTLRNGSAHYSRFRIRFSVEQKCEYKACRY